MPDAEPLQATVSFPLTVDAALSRTAQSVLRRECGSHIRAITLENIPDRHETRLWVTLAAAAYSVALHAVILGLPAAEFGAVRMSGFDAIARLAA
jgi:hypothetical protein